MEQARICPLCGKEYYGYPALSRTDNKTKICPECGTQEALADYFGCKVQQSNNTVDNEWSTEELRGVLYDECADALKKLDFLLDNQELKYPDNLADAVTDVIGGNLVNFYNTVYEKLYKIVGNNIDNNDVFRIYDENMMVHIEKTLSANKSKLYIDNEEGKI